MAAALSVHRRTWQLVDRFLPLTQFMAAKLRAAGVADAQITVRPNAAADPGPPTPAGSGFFFAGRFDREKGVLLLLEAWRRAGLDGHVPLVIAGDGEFAAEVHRHTAELPGVRLTGAVTRAEVGRLMSEAAVVVVPSLGYEGFPRIVVEAFSRGRPVLATDVGALGELVDPAVGWKAEPDPASLARRLRDVARADPSPVGNAARERYLARYTPDVVLGQLLDVYSSVRR